MVICCHAFCVRCSLLSVYSSVCQSVCAPVCLSVCLCVYLSVCLSGEWLLAGQMYAWQFPYFCALICMSVCVSVRCVAVGWADVRLAVPSLLCSQLEPACRLLARWLSHDERGPAGGLSSPSRPLLTRADRIVWGCDAASRRHHMDVHCRLAASQPVPRLPGVPVPLGGRG